MRRVQVGIDRVNLGIFAQFWFQNTVQFSLVGCVDSKDEPILEKVYNFIFSVRIVEIFLIRRILKCFRIV